jgi:uncharacterized membrane protein YphA (DoxX/SURF4 family)
LLLLRVVIGSAALAEGRSYITGAGLVPAAWLVGLSAVACGALLLIGLLTPVVATVVAAGAAAVRFSLVPSCSPNLLDSGITLIFLLTMSVTIVGLGPGAFSMDARLFGRREIIIPPSS